MFESERVLLVVPMIDLSIFFKENFASEEVLLFGSVTQTINLNVSLELFFKFKELLSISGIEHV